jgi:superfamily II DNA helicase RecQ
MPTGSGKSLSFFSAPLIFPKKIFIVITPLVALTEDLSRRLAATNIRGGKWHDITDPLTTQLVLVSAHEAGTHAFYLWAKALGALLGRFFIDEAHHLYQSDSYRSCFDLFELLVRLSVPFTFLSATIFPISVPFLCEKMRIDPALLHTIRAPTARPNIKLTRTHCKDQKDLLLQLQHRFESVRLAPGEKGLIFCTTIANCKAVSTLLGIPYYIANMDPDPAINLAKRNEISQKWREGLTASDCWVVATLCFGQGIDENGVRYVFHYEVNNLTNYTQEIGRVGRDGEPSFAHLFYTNLPDLSRAESIHDLQGITYMRDFIEVDRCRRLSLAPLDMEVHSCCAIPGAQRCDYCDELDLVAPISLQSKQN